MYGIMALVVLDMVGDGARFGEITLILTLVPIYKAVYI